MHVFFSLSHYQQNELESCTDTTCSLSAGAGGSAAVFVNKKMHVKYNPSLAMVSLAVAVSMTVRMALFWACQLPMSPLFLKALVWPGFGQIVALWGKVREACHFYFSISGSNEHTWMASASSGLTARVHAVLSQIWLC